MGRNRAAGKLAFFPVHPTHAVRQVEVFEVHVDLVSKSPCGQLKKCGYVWVVGRLTTAKAGIQDSPHVVVEDDAAMLINERRPTLRPPDATGSYNPTRDTTTISLS